MTLWTTLDVKLNAMKLGEVRERHLFSEPSPFPDFTTTVRFALYLNRSLEPAGMFPVSDEVVEGDSDFVSFPCESFIESP